MAQTTKHISPRTAMAEKKTEDESKEMPLGKVNFIIMGISLLLIIVGFALTSGSPSGLEEYNPDIFSARRIVAGPALCFIGFVLMAVAIIVKPKGK